MKTKIIFGGFMIKIEKRAYVQLFMKIMVALMLTMIVCLCTMSASCKIQPEGITILESDYSTPKLQNIRLTGPTQLYLEFDKEITLKNLEITSENHPNDKTSVDISIFGKNTVFFIDCGREFSILDNYQFFGVVEDEKYNSLTFSSVLQGFNANIPKLKISELRSYYQKPKLEFVEFFAESDGNLAGMVLEVFYKTEAVEFVFPPVEVKQGDFFVVHGRKMDETCINESNNLEEATYKDAVPEVLDFWLDSDAKVIGNSGVILLRERKNGDLCDALLYTEPDKTDWANNSVKEAAVLAVDSGVWVGSSSVEDAAINKKPSGTRSLSRDFSISEATSLDAEVSSKDMWIFVNNGNATMGKENSLAPFEG